MTFRHPLRNEWEKHQPTFAIAATGAGEEAAIAQAMLKMMPPFLDVIEQQRDVAMSPERKTTAMFAVIGMLLENTIEAAWRTPNARVAALNGLLSRLNRTIQPRLAKAPAQTGGGGLILPGSF